MSKHPGFSAELLKLCGQMRDQMITPAESQRLNDMLLESKAARQFYLKFMSITSALETGQAESAVQTAAAEIDSDSDVGLLLDLLQMEQEAPTATVCVSKQSAPKQPKPQKTALHINQGLAIFIAGQAIRSKPARWFAAAAVVAIGILIAVQFIGPSVPLEPTPTASHTPAIEPERTPVVSSVATLTAARGARWDTPAGNLAPTTGESLRPGDRLTLTAGFAEITTEEGAVVILEAPATVELLDNDNAIRLHTGKLVGICETESSKGFVVRTPHMDITDLGTRFGVDASAWDATEVHVFTGSVEAMRLADTSQQPERVLLKQGQAVRADESGERLVKVQSDQQRFAAIDLFGQPVLGGTGVGLAVGDKDPNWQVIAIGGDLLDEPVLMGVATRLSNTHKLADAVPGVQYLKLHEAIVSDISAYINDKRIRYTVRSTLVLPEDFDPSRDALTMQFEADDRLLTIQLNGQKYAAPPNQYQPNGNELYRMAVPSENLKPGPNTVELEIEDLVRSNNYVWGFGIAWHLEAKSEPAP